TCLGLTAKTIVGSRTRLCLPLIRRIGLTPRAAGIHDAVHRRETPSPLSPGSATAHCEARVRLYPMISVSASRYSSRRTSTGSGEDAARRSRLRGQGIPDESSQSPAWRTRFARASGAQLPLLGCPMPWPDAKIVLHKLGLDPESGTGAPPPARTIFASGQGIGHPKIGRAHV